MLAQLVRVGATLGLVIFSGGALLANHECKIEQPCGTGSKRCWPNAECVHCTHAAATDMCMIQPGFSCSTSQNFDCGAAMKGRCLSSGGAFGTCVNGTSWSEQCQVPQCP